MNADDRLAAFLSETPATRTGDVFVAEVMAAVERRAFRDQLLGAGAAAGLASVVLWACSPALNLAVSALAPVLAPVAGMLVLAFASIMLGERLLRRT